MTPNIKRKKNFFKFYFFMSIFLISILCSYYIYAEYDRNKSEQISQQILEQISFTDNTTIPKEEAIVVFLDQEETEAEEINIIENEEEETVNSLALKEGIEKLKPREKEIIYLRYFKCQTQKDVARLVGISQVQVCRIEKQILQTLGQELKEA